MQNCPHCTEPLELYFSYCPSCGLELKQRSLPKKVLEQERAVDRLERRLSNQPLQHLKKDSKLFSIGLVVASITGVNLILAFFEVLIVELIGSSIQWVYHFIFVLTATLPALVAYFLPKGPQRRLLTGLGIALVVLSLIYLGYNF